MKRHRAWPAAAGSALALLLAACGGGTTSASQQSPQTASQTFTYDTYTGVMIDGWDPATEYSNGIIAMSEMYQTLTHYNSATHQIQPLLATSWSSSSDGKTWTFQLRHGVHFHTGRLMTAQAVKASVLRTMKLTAAPRTSGARCRPSTPPASTRWCSTSSTPRRSTSRRRPTTRPTSTTPRPRAAGA